MPELAAICREIDADLSALIDAELAPEREAELRVHLDDCDRCAQRLQDLCNVDLALADLAVPRVAADLGQRLAARIASDAGEESEPVPDTVSPKRSRTATPRQPRRWPRRRLTSAAVVAAAVLLAIVVANWQGSEIDPDESQLARTPRSMAPDVTPPETVARVADFGSLADEDLAVLFELDTVKDLDVIANLELLEQLIAMEAFEG
jgi:anti-sigma factor RsiW